MTVRPAHASAPPPRLRLSVQDRLVPGDTLRARFEDARRYGFDAIELSERPAFEEAREAIRERIPVSAICGGYRGWLIDPDPEQAAVARADLERLVDLAGEIGTGCVVVPIWGRTRHLPGIATGRTREEDEEIFVDAMQALGSRAERTGALLYIEPLNRYQNDVCVTIADALRLRERVGSPAVRVMGDAFHMNIEEADMGAALTSAGEWLGYVHLADSQRLEPGMGHLDFGPIFAALARLRYAGYASLECARLSGDADVVLPRAVSYLRAAINDAA
ncbi:MAG: TIM barrel protein [Candidatus Limnocylindria bacterium]